MFEKDALLSKISIIKNCLRTIDRVEHKERGVLDDFLVDDIVVLNLEQASQACIDSAHIIIAEEGLKLPATYKESFNILAKEKLISNELSTNMMKMCGFRNVAVYTYQEIRPEILHSIVKHHLRDFEEFYTAVYKYIQDKWEEK